MNLEELEAAWNEQADDYNQWGSLGLDEMIEFAQTMEVIKYHELWQACRSLIRYAGTDKDKARAAVDTIKSIVDGPAP